MFFIITTKKRAATFAAAPLYINACIAVILTAAHKEPHLYDAILAFF